MATTEITSEKNGVAPALAVAPQVSDAPQITEDLCEVAFPPEVYGTTPEAVEQTIQDVIERIFRDENGTIRSGVFGKTMVPLRYEDIHDRLLGVGCFTENCRMPNELKPLWLNYENANQASGKYIVSMLQKHRVTGDPAHLALARRTYESFVLLWENVARDNPYGRGWMPKPYANIMNVAGSLECSVDQYTDITLGIETFYRTQATHAERITIRNMVLSFADWWIERDFTHSFMGECLWYKRMDFPHVITWFLYVNALAYSFSPQKKYQEAFELWLEKSGSISASLAKLGISTELSLRVLERLIDLRPEHTAFWKTVMQDNADFLISLVPQKDNMTSDFKGQFQFNGFLMGCLPPAHRVFPERGYADHIRTLIPTYYRRADFYHVSRGVKLEDLDSRIKGDDYRNTFFAEGQIGWLNGYWLVQELDHGVKDRGRLEK
jgi:hypothetical protein